MIFKCYSNNLFDTFYILLVKLIKFPCDQLMVSITLNMNKIQNAFIACLNIVLSVYWPLVSSVTFHISILPDPKMEVHNVVLFQN